MHIQKMRHIKNISYTYYQWLHQAPLVQTLDSAIQRISVTEINYAIHCMDSDLSGHSAIRRLNNRGQ